MSTQCMGERLDFLKFSNAESWLVLDIDNCFLPPSQPGRSYQGVAGVTVTSNQQHS